MTDTSTLTPRPVGEVILADRQRRKLSRKAYAAVLSVTETKVYNLEHGRMPTAGEWDALLPLIGDMLDPNAPQPALPEPKVKAKKAKAASSLPPPPPAPVSDKPVWLLTSEELEMYELDEEEEQQPIVVGSSLPQKYEFKHPGYHVSNSELRTFKRCRRKWFLAYYRELRLRYERPVGARPLGTRIHLALESKANGYDPFKALEMTIDEDRILLTQRQDIEALAELEKEAELARIMLEGYFEWRAESGLDQGYTVVGNETIIEVPFLEADVTGGTPVVLVGKIDQRVRREMDQSRFFRDYKTVGSLTEPLKTLHMDEQMLMYHLLEYLDAARTPDDITELTHGGLYTMLKKVKRTMRAHPPFFDEVEVRHNEHELRNFMVRVRGEIRDLMELRMNLDYATAGELDEERVAIVNEFAYPNPTRDCTWDCDFIHVCPMFDDGSRLEDALSTYFTKGDPHDHYRPFDDYKERE